MVKTIKYIIKRILIGVGIALVLYFCRDLLCLQVHAENRVLYPSASYYYYGNNGQGGQTPLQTFTRPNVPGITWYGYNGNSSGKHWQLARFDIDITRLTKKGYYNFDFLYLDNWQGALMENTTFAVYANHGYYSCKSNDSNTADSADYPAVVKEVVAVKCEAVYIDTDYTTDFRIIVFQNDSNSYGDIVGITTLNSNYLTENATEQMVTAATETNDLLKDDSIDNDKTSGDLETMSGKTASNGTITQLITLPITLFQSVLNSVGGSCSSMSLGTLYNHELVFPCLDLSSVLGSTLYNIIDILLCGSFILVIRKKFVDIFNHITSLKDRGNEVE